MNAQIFTQKLKRRRDYNSIKPFHFHFETQTSNLNDLLIAGTFANSEQILHHL